MIMVLLKYVIRLSKNTGPLASVISVVFILFKEYKCFSPSIRIVKYFQESKSKKAFLTFILTDNLLSAVFANAVEVCDWKIESR